jgi:hypothetical protein
MKEYNEKHFPVCLGLIVSGIALLIMGSQGKVLNIGNILSETINVSAITIGFLATTKSILFSIGNRRVIRELKDAELYNTIVDYLVSAIKWSFGLALLSAMYRLFAIPHIMTSVDILRDLRGNVNILISCFWLFVAVTMLGSCYRVIDIFTKLLKTNTIQE